MIPFLRSVAEALALTIATTVVAVISNAVTDSSDKGILLVGKPLAVAGTAFVPIAIENQTSSSISDLRLNVPLNTPSILSSEAIKVDVQTAAGASSSVAVLGDIPPSTRVQILVPVQDVQQAAMVKAQNANERHLDQRRPDEVDSTFKRFMPQLIANAFVYFCAFLLWSVFEHRAREGIRKTQADLERRLDVARAEGKETRGEMQLLRKQRARERVVLLHRLTHYREERDFWTDTVRKALSEHVSRDRVEAIVRAASASLRTYSTQGRNIDLDVFEAAIADADLTNDFVVASADKPQAEGERDSPSDAGPGSRRRL